jgi:hypothetical protein
MLITDCRLPNCSTWNNFNRRTDAFRDLPSTGLVSSVRLLHTNFHPINLRVSTLDYQNLGELFHVEQSIYPRDCTDFRHCAWLESALVSIE